jgi:hypothetical protein
MDLFQLLPTPQAVLLHLLLAMGFHMLRIRLQAMDPLLLHLIQLSRLSWLGVVHQGGLIVEAAEVLVALL